MKSPQSMQMKVVEHEESEMEDYDLGSPHINKALKDILKARHLMSKNKSLVHGEGNADLEQVKDDEQMMFN